MSKPRKHSIGSVVRLLVQRDPDITIDRLVSATGLTRRQCTYHRWWALNPDRKAEHGTRWRRKEGIRPREEVHAEQRANAEALAKRVIKIKQAGASFSEVGHRLGISRNAVAGRIWRAKQRLKAEGAQA